MTPATAIPPLFAGTFDPSDFFKSFNPMLFGCVPLSAIVQLVTSTAGSLASKYMPKIVTQDIANAEAFLQKATALCDAVQVASTLLTGTSQTPSLVAIAQSDAARFATIVKSGLGDAGPPLTALETAAMSAASAAAATAATTIQSYATQMTAIAAAGQTVASDVTSFLFSNLLGTTGMDGDLGKLIDAVQSLLNTIAALKQTTTPLTAAAQAAAAASSYLGALASSLQQAVSAVQSFLSDAGQLLADLNTLAQGLELPTNLSVEFKWQPLIQGVELGNMLGFVPSTAQALSLDVAVNTKAVNGTPAGANITCRLDQFALAFGGNVAANVPVVKSGAWGTFSPTDYSRSPTRSGTRTSPSSSITCSSRCSPVRSPTWTSSSTTFTSAAPSSSSRR